MMRPITLSLACFVITAGTWGCGDEASSTSTLPAADASVDTAPDAASEDGAADDASADAPPPDAAPIDAALDTASEETSSEASTDAGVGWKVEVVDGTPKFKSRVAIATAPDGEPRLAYNIATSENGYQTPEVWYAERKAGQWTNVLAAAASGVSNEFPVIAVDTSGTSHVIYKRYQAGQNDLFLVKGDAAGFSAPVNLTNSADADEFAAMAAFDSNGGLHVIFQRTREDPNATPPKTSSLGYLLVSPNGSVSGDTDLSTTSESGLDPDYSLFVTASNTVHVAYCKPGSGGLNNVAWYRRFSAGSWSDELRITALDQDVWAPLVGADDSGTVHFVYAIGPDWDHKTLTYDRLSGDQLAGAEALSTSALDRAYYLGMRVRPDGAVHVAFSRFHDIAGDNMGDVHYLRGINGIFEPEERITSTDMLDESATALSLSANGSPFVAFVENLSSFPDGKVYLASRP